MKKTVLTIAALAFFMMAEAQTVKTYTYPDGNKQAEGAYIGDGSIDMNASKEVQAQQASLLKKDGKWTTWFENGTMHTEEYYTNGVMTGTWKTWYEDGTKESEINFTTGKVAFYYKNGTKQSEGDVADGMIYTGTWTGYFEDGKKNYTGSYNSQGQKIGTWYWYDLNGKVTAQQVYENGNLVEAGK